MGILLIHALAFGVHLRAPDFRKLSIDLKSSMQTLQGPLKLSDGSRHGYWQPDWGLLGPTGPYWSAQAPLGGGLLQIPVPSKNFRTPPRRLRRRPT